MKYILVYDESINKLTRQVNELIEDGWVPQGGISSNVVGSEPCYYQAMVMNGNEK